MARKVFISVLGTGFYGECIYKFNGFSSSNTRFIQRATLEMLTSEAHWTAEDHGYILLTDGANTNNWSIKNNVRTNVRSNVAESYIGLKETIESLNLLFPVDGVSIPVGNDENEIWQIFETLFDKLQTGDELYFDITHGFRYLPMLLLVLGNYAKFLKNVTIKSITYGNFEAREKADDNDVAPIIDVTAFSTLQNWTSAASDFLNHGDATKLAECGNNQLRPILKETKGKDEAAVNLRTFCVNLTSFTDSVRFCRGMDVFSGSDPSKLQDCLKNIDGKYLKPLLPLLGMVDDFVSRFRKSSAENMLVAAEWSAKFGNWQAAITLLEEGIISFFCVRHNIRPDDSNGRKIVNRALKKKQLLFDDKVGEYMREGDDFEKKVDEVMADELLHFGLARDFSNLSDVRNDVNHAGMRNFKKPLQVKKIKSNIDKCLNNMINLTNIDCRHVPHLFINLSNHPSSSWNVEQVDAAKSFGKIIDMAFPLVAPDSETEDLDALAKDIIDKIMAYASENDVTVHVMGEMGLTYKIVKKLRACGIRCVCSTSYRVVEDEGNGKRTVEFHFNKFRDYE